MMTIALYVLLFIVTMIALAKLERLVDQHRQKKHEDEARREVERWRALLPPAPGEWQYRRPALPRADSRKKVR